MEDYEEEEVEEAEVQSTKHQQIDQKIRELRQRCK